MEWSARSTAALIGYSFNSEKIFCTRLRPEAARREVSVDRLIRDLLDIIVDDKLTTAILDD